jgi:hypothetical protein
MDENAMSGRQQNPPVGASKRIVDLHASRIAIASGVEAGMKFRVGERVKVEGREGEFVVVDLDVAAGLIVLLTLSGFPRIESDIPINLVRALRRTDTKTPNWSEAAKAND